MKRPRAHEKISWWRRLRLRLQCRWHGHDLRVLEEYERRTRRLSLLLLGRSVLRCPHIEATIRGKLQCLRCGQVSLGWVTKRIYHRPGGGKE